MAPPPTRRARGRLHAGLLGAILLPGLLPAPAPAQIVSREKPAAAAPLGVAGRSLLLPGWGQHVLGQKRAWAYGAAEIVLWALWGNRRSLGADARGAYHDLAWREARGAPAARVDGDWNYYEKLSHWQRSGAFDADPTAAGIQPEEDASTFNGSIWRRARDLHFGGGAPAPDDPAFLKALAYYRIYAYGPELLWDWSGREAALEHYRELIDESDDRFREATTALGMLIANHLLAGADAYLSSLPGQPQLRAVPPPAGTHPGAWGMGLRLRTSR